MTEVLKELGASHAIVNKIQTLQDGGSRVTLDLGQDASELLKELYKHKLDGNDLVFVAFTTPGE